MGIQLNRRLHHAHDVIESIELVVDRAEIEMQIGILGIVADPFLQYLCRIVELFLLEIGQSQHDVGFRLFGVDRDGLRQVRDGIGKLLQSIEDQTEMQMSFEVGRLELILNV